MANNDFKRLFKQIAKTESGKEQNLEGIETQLAHLKEGAALSYLDLELISEPKYWPFNKHWMWPHRSQIEKKLETTEGWFKDLPSNEREIIRKLNNIFKNIGLVSIVLRFARPEFYAIYSLPVLQIMRIERGGNEVEDYLNYISELRVLRTCFGVDNTAAADEIVWAIFHHKNKYGADLKKILAKRLPENLTAEELLIYLSNDPLKVSKEYMKRKDHMTAGFWAAKAFEKLLDDECRQAGIFIPDPTHKRSKMISALCNMKPWWNKPANRELLYDTKEMRNNIVPGVNPFTFQYVEQFIANIDQLKSISVFRGY
jgi:hypothetical protein